MIRRYGLPVITAGGAAPSTGPHLALPRGVLNLLRQQILKALISEKKPRFCNYMRRWIFINYCGNDFMIYVSLHNLNSLSAAYKSNLDKTERKKNSMKTCKRHEQMLHKEDRQMAKKHKKGCPSTSLFIRAM